MAKLVFGMNQSPGADGYPASRAEAAVNSSCYTDEDCHRSQPNAYCVAQGNQLLCANG